MYLLHSIPSLMNLTHNNWNDLKICENVKGNEISNLAMQDSNTIAIIHVDGWKYNMWDKNVTMFFKYNKY